MIESAAMERPTEGDLGGDLCSTQAQALATLRVGVCVWHLEEDDTPASLRLVVANAAACRFLGVARDAVLGRRIHEAFPGSQATPLPGVFTGLAMRGGSLDLGEVPYRDEVVQEGVFSIIAETIAPRLVCVQFTNITEQKRLESLQQTNAALVEQLAAQAAAAREEAERSRALVAELDQKLEIIASQSAQIQALSAPVLDLADGVLAVPLIGEFTPARAADVTATLLAVVAERRARSVLLDVTGLSALDSESAAQLERLVMALRLLGADGIVTGIRPQLARTLVEVGGLELRAFRSLSDGLRACLASA